MPQYPVKDIGALCHSLYVITNPIKYRTPTTAKGTRIAPKTVPTTIIANATITNKTALKGLLEPTLSGGI